MSINLNEHRTLQVSIMTEYTTRDGEKKTRFDRCGVAFINKDGSMNIKLDALPANGQTLHVRPFRDRDDNTPDFRPGGADRRKSGDSDIPF